MQVIDFHQHLDLDPKAVLSLGGFDGIHLGHQRLIHRLKAKARQKKTSSGLLLLDPLPFQVLKGLPFKRLFTIKETCKLLEPFGLDFVCLIPFNKTFARLSPKEFIDDFLESHFAPSAVLAGYDFRFGRNREGDLALLKKLAPFEIEHLEAVQQEGGPISSSRIRERLAQADMEGVRHLLGRPFSIEGRVVKGEGRGQALGFPTANLQPEGGKTLPPLGVYAGKLVVDRCGASSTQGVKNPSLLQRQGVNPLLQQQGINLHSQRQEVNPHSQRQGAKPPTQQKGSKKTELFWPQPPQTKKLAPKTSQGPDKFPMLVNIGHRPSFAGGRGNTSSNAGAGSYRLSFTRDEETKAPPFIEAHVLSHNEDFYGQWIKLELDFFIRKEKVFPNPSDLQAAIRQDIKKAQIVWNSSANKANKANKNHLY